MKPKFFLVKTEHNHKLEYMGFHNNLSGLYKCKHCKVIIDTVQYTGENTNPKLYYGKYSNDINNFISWFCDDIYNTNLIKEIIE